MNRDGGERLVILGQIGEGGLAAGQLDHARDVIGIAPHDDRAVRREVEEGDRLSVAFRGIHRLYRRNLLFEERLCLCEMTGEQAVELDPFHAAERVRLIARILHKKREAERDELFLHGGRVEDHRVLHDEIRALLQQKLIVRRAVFARILNRAVLERGAHRVQPPVGGFRARKRHTVERADPVKEIGGGGARKIHALHRISNHRELCEGRRSLGVLL